ncbi:MAG: class I SAM-dependent methyltransferase [Gammaproteobacteria bacterium]|nr:class I SAM-dependent methyltransferase [Gammaproteobacteria bacterium]
MLSAESAALRSVWPGLFGSVAVQVGCTGQVDLLEECNAPSRVLLECFATGHSGVNVVQAIPEALPFDTRSVPLMLLPHTLEFADDPHQVLREVSRVLAPEGHVVILGFNPLSLWGLWRLLRQRSGAAPWNGRFLHLARLKDWLKLLDFEFTRGSMHYYRPPLSGELAMDRLRFLDKAGDRWWPMTGAVYLLVAKKRVAGMTPILPAWRTRRQFVSAVARPALRVIRGG